MRRRSPTLRSSPAPRLGSLGIGAILALAASVLWAPVRADTVILHNGDRLTGRILHMSPGTLTFETTWAGELKIPRYEVRTIETDKPIAILREPDGRTESVMLRPAEPGMVAVVPQPRDGPASGAPDGPAPAAAAAPPAELVKIARLRYLNPKPEESGEGVSYQGRATVSGAFARGDTARDRVYAEADFGARALEWRYAVTGKLLQERDRDGTTASNWLASGNFDRFLDADSFLYARGSLERDRFRDISQRASLGGGYGRQLLQTERTSLSVRGGLEMISVQRVSGQDDTSPALGWGLNVSHRIDLLSAELFHDQRGTSTIDGDAQLSVRSRTGLRLPFASGLTASLQLNLDWDDQKAASASRSSSTWLIGLGYSW